MCLKCDLIDVKIKGLQLSDPGFDPLSRALMRADLESLRAEKAAIKCDASDVPQPPVDETD
jgi:hypothetical protein